MSNVPAEIKKEIIRRWYELLMEEKLNLYHEQFESIEATCVFLEKKKGEKIYSEGFKVRGFEDAINHKQGDFFEVVSATGTGKTRGFGTLLKPLASHATKKIPAIVVTPRRLLNAQSIEELTNKKKVGIDPELVGIYDSDQRLEDKERALVKPVLITTPQGLAGLLKDGFVSTDPTDPHYRPLIIFDEIHEQMQGDKMSQLVETFMETCIVGGFTATDGGVYNNLFQGQAPIYYLGLVETIAEREPLVRHAKAFPVAVEVDEQWVSQVKLQYGADYPEAFLDELATSQGLMKAMVRTHFNFEDPHIGHIHRLPTAFYVNRVQTAEYGARMFNKYAYRRGLDVRAEAISGYMTPAEQKEVLARFRAGETIALFNDKYIGLGFDDSNLSVVHSGKMSRFSDVPTQQFGRAARKQGDDYFARFGHNKIAIGFSYIPNGVHPFTFNDVLEGQAQVYNPDHGSFNAIEEGPEYVEFRGIKIYMNTGAVTRITAENRRHREEELGALPENWMTLQDAKALTNLSYSTVVQRANKIKPDEKYEKNGMKPKDPKKKGLVMGSELVRKTQGGRKIVHVSLVEGWVQAEEKKQHLLKKGYVTAEQMAQQKQLSEDDIRKALRAVRRAKNGKPTKKGTAKKLPDDIKEELGGKKARRKKKDRGHGK